MTIQYIDLSNTDYDSTRQVSLDGSPYIMRIFYSPRMDGWIMNLADGQENDIVNGVPLVIGIDLLSSCRSGGNAPPGSLVMYNSVNETTDANSDNLGSDVFLLYIPIDDVIAIQQGTYTG